MHAERRLLIVWLVLAIVAAGCAAPPSPTAAPRAGEAQPQAPSAPKRITAAIMGDPPTLVQELNGFGTRGVDAIEDLTHVGLSIFDLQGNLHPVLAEAVPTIENGLWKLLPDGRMETTWKLRPNLRWHDGTPLTSDDLLFAVAVGQDRELPEFGHTGFTSLEGVTATDPRTVTVRWKQPYVDADKLFGTRFASPLPKHLLERAYMENKASFTQLPYWSTDFVSSGPFKVREFVGGSHVVLDAFDGYALGRPKVDVVEVRFIPDAGTTMANLLAGGVDLTLGINISLEQAIEVRDQWRAGTMGIGLSNAQSVYPQFLNPSNPLILNLQFRRALYHAINRQEMADTLMAGLSPVAHTFMYPNQAQYREIEAAVPKYEYDPRRATQIIEALGYSRGPDGFLRDAAARQLAVELRTYTGDVNTKGTLAVADYWQKVGVKVDVNVMSPQQSRDNEYVFTYPGFMLQRYSSDTRVLPNLYGARAPTPENNFRQGNIQRYQNPEFDALLDRYFATIPLPQRIRVLGEILYHVADQVSQMPILYDAEPTMIANRLVNVHARWPSSTQAWNSHEWDVKL